jgi:hypothetical protein
LSAHPYRNQHQTTNTDRQPTKSTMLAQILRYIATCLAAAADWIAPTPPPAPINMVAAANRCRIRKNDIFLTPEEVAKHHIESVKSCAPDSLIWVDPFRNTGIYYKNFPEMNTKYNEPQRKDWCEILEGRDALKYDYHGTIVCSNPPYSLINQLLDQMVETEASAISLLIGCVNLTTPRLNKMREAGYTIADLQLYNVKGYFGTSFAITWVRDELMTTDSGNIIGINYKKGGYKVDQSAAMRQE